MILFRFMSRAEYNKYNAGKKLFHMNPYKKKYNTTSKGFCFMSLDDIKPQVAYDFLLGIVKDDVLCIFECKDLKKAGLKESKGFYAGFPEASWRREYCTYSYSKETLRLVKVKDPHKFLDFRF